MDTKGLKRREREKERKMDARGVKRGEEVSGCVITVLVLS